MFHYRTEYRERHRKESRHSVRGYEDRAKAWRFAIEAMRKKETARNRSKTKCCNESPS
jgi:hypothetical protein